MDDTEVDDVNEDLEEVLRGSISSSARLTGEAGTDGLRHRKGGAADDGAAAETKGDDAGAEVRGLKLTASKHGMVNEGILHQLLTQQREKPVEKLRWTVNYKSYRILVPAALFLVILNLLFPPVAINIPRNMPQDGWTHCEIHLLAECNVHIERLAEDATFDLLNLDGSIDANHFLPQVLQDGWEVWIRNLGLDPTCNVKFKIAADQAPNVTIYALHDSQVFIDDVTLAHLTIQTTGTSGGMYLAGNDVNAEGVHLRAGSGKLSLRDVNIEELDAEFEHRGYIDIQSDHSASVDLLTRDDVSCMAAPSIADSEADEDDEGALERSLTLHTDDDVADGTAATQHYKLSLPSEGAVEIRVGERVGAADGVLNAGVAFENLVGAGHVDRGVASVDGRLVTLVGLRRETFVDEHLNLVVLNNSGTVGTPDGVFYLANSEVYTYLPLPILQVVSGGVLQPISETVNAISSTCPFFPSDCEDPSATGVRDCVVHLEFEPGRDVPAGDPVSPELSLDPYFHWLKSVSEDVTVNEEDLWVGKPYSFEPRGDEGAPYILSTRSSAAVRSVDCVRETPQGNAILETGACLEKRGMSASTELEAVLALSLALASIVALAATVGIIAIVAEGYTNKYRASLILSTPASRELALGVLESFKIYAASDIRSKRCGCCTRVNARTHASDVEGGRPSFTRLDPVDVRVDRFSMGGIVYEPAIRDLSNPSFINKVEYVASKAVIDKEGTLWGCPEDGNGIWSCAAPRGRLEVLERPISSKKTLHRDTVSETVATFVPCSDECNFPTVETLRSISSTCGSMAYLFSDPPLAIEHARGCKSTIKRFTDDQKKLWKFLHLLQYVNDQTHPFFLIDSLFRSDPIPMHLDAARETFRYKLCGNCNEVPAAFLCSGNGCDGRKLCERCESVLHARVDESHKKEMVVLRDVFMCSYCHKRRGHTRCSECEWGDDGLPGSILCTRCDSVLHRSMGSHKRTQLRVCDLCSIKEGKQNRKQKGANENRSGYYCSDCSGILARMDAIVSAEQGDAVASVRSGESGSASVSSSAITASGWDKTDVSRRIFYQLSHPLAIEAAVVITQMALIIAPTIPLIVLSDTLLKAFFKLFGESLGPAGPAVRTASVTFRAWSAAFMLFGAFYYLVVTLQPTGYIPRVDEEARKGVDKDGLKKKQSCCSLTRCVNRLLESACCRITNQNHTNMYRFQYSLRLIFLVLLALTLLPALAYVVLVCLWVLLGVFIEPDTVLPYASGIIGAVAHGFSMYKTLTSAYRAVFDGVKRGIMEERLKEEGETDEVEGTIMPEVTDTEVERWLSRAGLSPANIAATIASSMVVLIWVLAFIFLGIGAFSAPSTSTSVINSGIVSIATLLVNRASSDDAEKEDIETREEKVLKMYRAAQARDASGFEMSVSETITSTLTRATDFFG